MSDTTDTDEVVHGDDFGIELDDVGEQEWREVDPTAPDPEATVDDS